MKLGKSILIITILIIILSITACGTDSDESLENDSDTVEVANNIDDDSDDNESIEVDEKLLTVDITLPGTFFEESSEEEIIALAKDEGYKAVKVNEDGSVTYTMTKAKRNEMLKDFKVSIDESIEDLLRGEEKVESFIDIKYNEDVSKVDIYVDPALYNNFDSMYVFGFYMYGAFYQNFDGVSPEDIDVIVNFIDNTTNEIIESGSYKNI